MRVEVDMILIPRPYVLSVDADELKIHYLVN